MDIADNQIVMSIYKNLPDLTSLTVNGIGYRMRQDGKEYKLLYIYNVCDYEFGKYISQTIIPYIKNIRCRAPGSIP